MSSSFISPGFLILSTLLLGGLNLLAPFVSRQYSYLRSFLLITISSAFFINILIIDWLFLHGIRVNLTLFTFGRYSAALHLEPVGLIFLNLLGYLWVCALIYTSKFLAINNMAHSSRFLFFLNLTLLSGVLLSLSANLFTMFAFYEILTLSTIPLIAHSGNDKVISGLYSYLKILMLSSMLLFLPAILIIYSKAKQGDFIDQGFIQYYFSRKETIALFLMCIFGIAKAALYPMHRWLPAAMVASYPVSALLHAVVVVKAGLFCIYKIILYIFGLKYLHTVFLEFNWLIYLPICTLLYSALKALQSNNIKKILAYSTINQLSIALLSSFMLTPKAIGAAILHMLSHSFTKICLFYGMGSIYSLQKVNQIDELPGTYKKMPMTSFIILIASFSLIGLPPFGGFISKFYIMLAAAEQSQILVMFVLLIGSILSAIYLLKLLVYIYKPVEVISGSVIAQELACIGKKEQSPSSMSSPPSMSSPRKRGSITTLFPWLWRNLLDSRFRGNDTVNRDHIICALPSNIEHKLPISMLVSLFLCLLGVVCFYGILIFIKQFLWYV